jgi:hypothetical protein
MNPGAVHARGARGRLCATALAIAVMTLTFAGVPAHGAELLDTLRGVTIEASTDYDARVRRPIGVFTAHSHAVWRLTIGADDTVTGSMTRVGTGRGRTFSKSRNFRGKLGVAREIAGSGNTVMIWSDNQLVILRTFESGGMKATFHFSQEGDQIKCALEAPLAREVGAGNIRRDSVSGGEVEFLSVKQVGSTCRVNR